MSSMLRLWLAACVLARASACTIDAQTLSKNLVERVEEVLLPDNFKVFEAYCSVMPADQLRQLIDKVPPERVARLLSKNCVKRIRHWELVTVDDVLNGRLPELDVSTVKISSFKPAVLLALLKRTHFLVNRPSALCQSPQLHKFVKSAEWMGEPGVMNLLDKACFERALDLCWSKEFVNYYEGLVSSAGAIGTSAVSDGDPLLGRWIIRISQFIESVVLGKGPRHCQLLRRLLAMRKLVRVGLKSTPRGTFHLQLLTFSLGHVLETTLSELISDTVELEREREQERLRRSHGTTLRSRSHDCRSGGGLSEGQAGSEDRYYSKHPKTELRKLKLIAQSFRVVGERVESGGENISPGVGRRRGGLLGRCPGFFDGSRLPRSANAAVSGPSMPSKEHLYALYSSIDPLREIAKEGHRQERDPACYWHRQFVLHVIGAQPFHPPTQLNKLFCKGLVLGDEEVEQWIDAMVARANPHMLDMCMAHTDSLAAVRYLEARLKEQSEAIRFELFTGSSNPVVKLTSVLLVDIDEAGALEADGMYEAKIYLDCYPDSEKLHDTRNEVTGAFLKNSIELLLMHSRAFATPSFAIEYMGQTGVDAEGIRTEWLQHMLGILGDPARRFFALKTGAATGLTLLMPAEFVDPQVMRVLGLLLGKCLQKGIQSPIALSPAFWRFLLSPDTPTSDGEATKACQLLIPSAMDDLKAMQRWSLSEMVENDLPADLSTTNIHAVHRNYPASTTALDSSFRPANAEQVAEYLLAWRAALIDSLHRGRAEFRKAFRLFTNLHWIDASDSAWVAGVLCDSTAVQAELLARRIDVCDAEAVTVKHLEGDKLLSFGDAFLACIHRLSGEELRQLLQFWTASGRLPIGGYALLHLSVKCVLERRSGLLRSVSCFKRLFCPAYPTLEEMHKSLVVSISLGHANGFDDDPVEG